MAMNHGFSFAIDINRDVNHMFRELRRSMYIVNRFFKSNNALQGEIFP